MVETAYFEEVGSVEVSGGVESRVTNPASVGGEKKPGCKPGLRRVIGGTLFALACGTKLDQMKA